MGCKKLTIQDRFILRIPQKILKSYNYDVYSQLSKLRATLGNISKNHHNDNALGKRTTMTKSGIAFTASNVINYIYNDRSEATSASSTVGIPACDFSYSYNQIGNRTSKTEAPAPSSLYTANKLNQYTGITTGGASLPSPSYDQDGNMIQCSLGVSPESWSFTFNAENRIIVAESASGKLEFIYDYAGRRVEKKVYSGSPGSWTLDTHLKFVYNGYVQIEELDALNSDAILKKRIWGGQRKILCDILY